MEGIFRADPHPGNVHILHDGTPVLLDFGSVGRFTTLQQDGLKRVLLGFERKESSIILDGLIDLVEPDLLLIRKGWKEL